MIRAFLRLATIIGSLPITLTNGTTADATQVMADLNWIVNQVNTNAAEAANTAVTNANNNFTAVQSGVAASQPANFPIAAQVQNVVFNTLSSTAGSNTITGRVAALPLSAYAVGQIFSWQAMQRNSGATTLSIDGLAAGAIHAYSQPFTGGELGSGIASVFVKDAATPAFELINPPPSGKNTLIIAKGDILSGVGSFQLIRNGAGLDGTAMGYFSSEIGGVAPILAGSGLATSGKSWALNFALSSTQITGSSRQLPINSAVQQEHPSASKAWGVVTPPTTVSVSYPSAGVSVVNNSTGIFTVTHGRTMNSNVYPVFITANFPGFMIWEITSRTPTAFQVSFQDGTTNFPADPGSFNYDIKGQIT